MQPDSNPSSGALQEAIARRGALNQQGPGSATPSPLPPTASMSDPNMIRQSPQGATKPAERDDDAALILKAMAERLKSQNKIEEAKVIPPKMPTTQGM